MPSLLDKFAKVEITSKSALTLDDQTFCIRLKEEYEEAHEKMTANLNCLREGLKEVEPQKDNLFQFKKYAIETPLKHGSNAIKELSHRVKHELKSYFNKKYNLNIHNPLVTALKPELLEYPYCSSFSSRTKEDIRTFKEITLKNKIAESRYEKEVLKPLDLDKLVDMIIKEVGNFKETGYNKLKEDFLKAVGYHYNTKMPRAELKGRIIAFSNLAEVSWSRNLREYSVSLLNKIYILHIRGDIGDQNIMMFPYNEKIDYDNSYGTPATQIKFYKNGRMDVKLESKEKAEAFFKFCSLDKQRP